MWSIWQRVWQWHVCQHGRTIHLSLCRRLREHHDDAGLHGSVQYQHLLSLWRSPFINIAEHKRQWWILISFLRTVTHNGRRLSLSMSHTRLTRRSFERPPLPLPPLLRLSTTDSLLLQRGVCPQCTTHYSVLLPFDHRMRGKIFLRKVKGDGVRKPRCLLYRQKLGPAKARIGVWPLRSLKSSTGLGNLLIYIFAENYQIQLIAKLEIHPQWTNCSYNYGQMHGACTKRLYFHFRSKIWRHHRVPRPRFLVRRVNFGDSRTFKADILLLNICMGF